MRPARRQRVMNPSTMLTFASFSLTPDIININNTKIQNLLVYFTHIFIHSIHQKLNILPNTTLPVQCKEPEKFEPEKRRKKKIQSEFDR